MATRKKLPLNPSEATLAQSVSTTENLLEKKETDNAAYSLIPQITQSVNLLLDKFQLAMTFARVAENMTLINDKEATAITSSFRNFTNYLPVMISIAGGILTLFGKSQEGTGVLAISVISATLVNLGASNKQSTEVQQKIKEVANWAKEKAGRLAVQAYLKIELSSISGAMSIITKDLEDMKKMPTSNVGEVIELARNYLAIVKCIDGFYDYQLAKMQSTLGKHAEEEYFTPTTRNDLLSLSKEVEKAGNTWINVRHLYTRSERAITEYLAQEPSA
jgi:hypothetical protein